MLVFLVNKKGESISDSINIGHDFDVITDRAHSAGILQYVDLCEDTVLNSLGMNSLKDELETILVQQQLSSMERKTVEIILELIRQGLNESGLYLKFYGD